MKKIIFFAVMLISTLTFKLADAQVSISLGLNIGSQPAWGPTGYDHAEYYYMPDIDTYYDVPNHQYIYLSGSRWTRSGALPPRYANYNVYNGYKAVINEPSPWLHSATYRTKYAQYKGRRGQPVIRDSHDEHYQNHWNGNNGNAYGHNKNNDHHDNRGHDDHHDNGHGHH